MERHGCSHPKRRLLWSLSTIPCLIGPMAEARGEVVAVTQATGQPTKGVQLTSRNVTYAKGKTLYDDGTWVAGGAEGSSFLMVRHRHRKFKKNRKETTWVFLHGDHLFLQVPGEPAEVITSRPGWGVTSKAGDWEKDAVEVDQRRLSVRLMQLYKAHGVLHVPFLTGRGWPEITPGKRGASASRARDILQHMRLNMMTVGSLSDGRVVEQAPAGGTPVSPGTTVWVRLDVPSAILPTAPVGDTNTNAVEITLPSGDKTEITVTAWLAQEHDDDPPDPRCGLDGTDIFFKLLSNPANARTVTVQLRHQGGPRLTLSAWKDDGGTLVPCRPHKTSCSHKRWPEITYNDENVDTYIVVDVKKKRLERRGPELVSLRIGGEKIAP